MPSPPSADAPIPDRAALIAVINELRDDFLRRGSEWENATLDSFLDALAAWLDAAPRWYADNDQELPAQGDWAVMARALMAARVYG
ncbi:DUF7660 family protein [Yinghuangia sp. YIM S09857]|uniref:DUF7660 family protein n=1 Tax=Yinghuangia sp. YIM S09857 TaxID=3436929 RepID=UPI003F535811